MKAQKLSSGYIYSFFNFGSKWGGGATQRHAPATLAQEKSPGICCTGGWMGLNVLEGCERISPPPRFDHSLTYVAILHRIKE